MLRCTGQTDEHERKIKRERHKVVDAGEKKGFPWGNRLEKGDFYDSLSVPGLTSSCSQVDVWHGWSEEFGQTNARMGGARNAIIG